MALNLWIKGIEVPTIKKNPSLQNKAKHYYCHYEKFWGVGGRSFHTICMMYVRYMHTRIPKLQKLSMGGKMKIRSKA